MSQRKTMKIVIAMAGPVLRIFADRAKDLRCFQQRKGVKCWEYSEGKIDLKMSEINFLLS